MLLQGAHEISELQGLYVPVLNIKTNFPHLICFFRTGLFKVEIKKG